MKFLKYCKSISIMFLLISIVLASFSCESSKNNQNITDNSIDTTDNSIDTDEAITESIIDNTSNDEKDYQVIKTEKGYRLVFDDPEFYLKNGCNIGVVGFYINSWEDFSDRLLAGILTLDEKTSIYYTFPKDEFGFIILNPYVSYKISHVLPHNVKHESNYTGGGYFACLTCEEYYEEMIFVGVLEYYRYKNVYKSDFADIDNKEIIVEYETELANGSVMRCYNKTTETSKYFITVKYILSDGTKTIFVEKRYDEGSSIPYKIHLLGNIGDDQYFEVINVFEAPQILQHEVKEDLTDEFLFGFDVEAVERT